MLKTRTLKPIKAGYEDQKIAFYPRTISQAEFDDVERQLAEADAETLNKYQRKFEIKRQAIADWSAQMPAEIVTEKGEAKLVPLGKENDISAAVNSFFATRTNESERLISAVHTAFVSVQSADVDFL